MDNRERDEHILELISGYCLGDLDPDELQLFQKHLEADPSLGAEVADFQEILALLPQTLPQPQPVDTVAVDHIWMSLRDQIQTNTSGLVSQSSHDLSGSDLSSPDLSLQDLSTLDAIPSVQPHSKRPSTSRAQTIRPSEPQSDRRVWTGVRFQRLLTGLSLAGLLGLGLHHYRLQQTLADLRLDLQHQKSALERFPSATEDDTLDPEALTRTVAERSSILNEQWLEQNFSGLEFLFSDYHRATSTGTLLTDIPLSQPQKLTQKLKREAQLPTPMPLLSPAQTLLGGSVCQFGTAKGVRLTYENSDQTPIAFYQVQRLSSQDFPLIDQDPLFVRLSDNSSAVLWTQDGFFFAVVSELPFETLQDLKTNLAFVKS